MLAGIGPSLTARIPSTLSKCLSDLSMPSDAVMPAATQTSSGSGHYSKTILVTGGAGYIGAHTCLELLLLANERQAHAQDPVRVVVVDNLCNSSQEALNRVRVMTERLGIPATELLHFHQVDLQDRDGLRAVFEMYSFDAVIHFAGLKAVGESVLQPLHYYRNNITGTVVLLDLCAEFQVKRMVFSSSATVYGEPERLPLTEDCRVSATNPYGRTKLYIEGILTDLCGADPQWKVIILRYFNPVGSHESGLIGEDPQGVPNNLMPFVAQVSVGKRSHVSIFGADYPTKDGTGVRDYIHVTDLALGHLAALNRLLADISGCEVYNLGTGIGYSVLEMIRAMSKASGREIAYTVTDRRPGDVAVVYADVSLAAEKLGWNATRNLQTMCNDLWLWQSHHPLGFGTQMDGALLDQWLQQVGSRATGALVTAVNKLQMDDKRSSVSLDKGREWSQAFEAESKDARINPAI